MAIAIGGVAGALDGGSGVHVLEGQCRVGVPVAVLPLQGPLQGSGGAHGLLVFGELPVGARDSYVLVGFYGEVVRGGGDLSLPSFDDVGVDGEASDHYSEKEAGDAGPNETADAYALASGGKGGGGSGFKEGGICNIIKRMRRKVRNFVNFM